MTVSVLCGQTDTQVVILEHLSQVTDYVHSCRSQCRVTNVKQFRYVGGKIDFSTCSPAPVGFLDQLTLLWPSNMHYILFDRCSALVICQLSALKYLFWSSGWIIPLKTTSAHFKLCHKYLSPANPGWALSDLNGREWLQCVQWIGWFYIEHSCQRLCLPVL